MAMPAVAAAKANALVQEMQAVEDGWDAALTKRDQYGLENALGAQLVDIAATGDVTTRNQDIARMLAKEGLPLSMKQKVLTVRRLADGLVLVSGTYVLQWPETSGLSATGVVDEKGIFTQVFQMVGEHWACMNSQRTVVAAQMPPVKTPAAKPRPKSNAAEPFHVPLFFKGAQPNATQPATPQK